MKLILKTSDPVKISWVCALLRDAHIDPVVLDTNMSILEGSIGVLPRRIMVADDDLSQARRVLTDADIEYTNE